MTDDTLLEQVIDLQTRVAYQEDTLQALNQVIARQDEQLRRLQAQLQAFGKRFEDHMYAQEQAANRPPEERPPHY